MGGRKSDSAVRNEQGKAAPSDFDGNDANRRPLPPSRSVHAPSDAAARGAASGFQPERLRIAGLDVENFEQRCPGDLRAVEWTQPESSSGVTPGRMSARYGSGNSQSGFGPTVVRRFRSFAGPR